MALAIALAAACGPATHPPAGTLATATQKTVTPLAIKADAKSPSTALILGTDDKGGSTLLPLTAKEATVTVDAMFVQLGNGPARGDAAPVKLTTAPNPDGDVRVGIYEQFAGGAGPQWRAGVWISSFVAATTLGKDLTDFKFSADAGGNVDGASASGLMTAGLLAALLGTPVDPKAAMTGIINPDGSIGPVGGIPHKFLASIEKGKTRLGFPIGQRFDEDLNTHQPVDLVALAKEHGATATEIADVYGAYQFLTGKTLPRPIPVEPSDMAVDDAVTAALEAKYADWQKMIAQNLEHLVALYNERGLPESLQAMALVAKAQLESAEKLRKDGLAAAAYDHITTAWIYAASATSTQEILGLVQDGDLMGAQARLRDLQGLASQTEAALRQIGTIKPDTLGGHLRMISAYRRAITGWGFHVFSSEVAGQTQQFLEGLGDAPRAALASPDNADKIVEQVAPSVLAIARAVAATQAAVDGLDIESEKSVSYFCSLPNVKRLAKSYQSASAANLTYFEALFVKELAKNVGVPFEQAQTRFAMIEPDYLVATMAANLPNMAGLADALKQEWGEDSIAWGLATLAGSELSFFKASLLISKWYSLGVQNDEVSGRPKSVEHEKAFFHMLDAADRSARENARAARVATGSIPIQARIAYQNAKVLREGDVADKLGALQQFWQSSVYSQTAVMLARN